MTDMPIVSQSPQKEINTLDKNLAQINLSSTTNGLNKTLSKFDPLQQPTPKRSTTYKHASVDHKISLLIPQDMPTIHLVPTPPSSPVKPTPQSSIAQLVEPTTPKEKPNLSDFDPLMTRKPTMDLILSGSQKKDIPSKLRQPTTQISARRLSNDLEHTFTKEREKSRRLSANLVSAQGIMSLPPPIDLLCDNPHAVHDRLQNLVENENDFITPTYASSKYSWKLSDYEKTEINNYQQIYFIGPQALKIRAETNKPQQNYGYDDEVGNYHIKIKDHLNYRYEIIESIDKGSFGQVVKCRDHKPNTSDPLVAVKIIRNKKRFYAQAQKEIEFLEQLKTWDPDNKYYNVRILNHFDFREHCCIVFECLSSNLYEVIKQNKFQGFSLGLVKRFAYQILKTLTLLSQHNVIHCDLKPENILLKKQDRSGIRIIDYGNACYADGKVHLYIQSRFYRAPEIILGAEYGLPIDMWSTGCILVELYRGHPIFPGMNEHDQLAGIMRILGIPKKDYLEKCTRRKLFFDRYDHPKIVFDSSGRKMKPNTVALEDALKRPTQDQIDKDFVDFISRCLTWDPSQRIKPEEALSHPWIQTMRE